MYCVLFSFSFLLTVIPKILMQETCLASVDAMPFDLLKKKLMTRLQTMGVRITKIYEEVFSQSMVT